MSLNSIAFSLIINQPICLIWRIYLLIISILSVSSWPLNALLAATYDCSHHCSIYRMVIIEHFSNFSALRSFFHLRWASLLRFNLVITDLNRLYLIKNISVKELLVFNIDLLLSILILYMLVIKSLYVDFISIRYRLLRPSKFLLSIFFKIKLS